MIIKSLGEYINKHFGSAGGFSSRLSRDQFVTVLPFSDIKEAEGILGDFSRDLQGQGLFDIQAEAHIPKDQCFEFVVLAGLAKGKSGDQMETTIESAKSQQKIIARFNCETRR